MGAESCDAVMGAREAVGGLRGASVAGAEELRLEREAAAAAMAMAMGMEELV